MKILRHLNPKSEPVYYVVTASRMDPKHAVLFSELIQMRFSSESEAVNAANNIANNNPKSKHTKYIWITKFDPKSRYGFENIWDYERK